VYVKRQQQLVAHRQEPLQVVLSKTDSKIVMQANQVCTHVFMQTSPAAELCILH
jgi:hypothetical protein